MGNGTSIEHLAKIREAIGRTFTLSELRSLAFDLGIDVDTLRGEEKKGKTHALLDYYDTARSVIQSPSIYVILNPIQILQLWNVREIYRVNG